MLHFHFHQGSLVVAISPDKCIKNCVNPPEKRRKVKYILLACKIVPFKVSINISLFLSGYVLSYLIKYIINTMSRMFHQVQEVFFAISSFCFSP